MTNIHMYHNTEVGTGRVKELFTYIDCNDTAYYDILDNIKGNIFFYK